ncbi:MAG: hypothetical protein K2K82_09610 [Muribaculaceae bacterium]|nr:hypothetical protein [Muribaculaceae bacterium]
MDKVKGYLLAGLAAAAYGTNPAFAIPLYEQWMNANSVLLFRYLLGVPIMAIVMSMRHVSFRLTREESGPVAILGLPYFFSKMS